MGAGTKQRSRQHAVQHRIFPDAEQPGNFTDFPEHVESEHS
jgi:hypothetical protein